MRSPALLLDLGGTVFRSGAEMIAVWAEHEPRIREPAARRGPLGPELDPTWERMLREEITERDYWALRAAEFGRVLGQEWRIPDLMREMYAVPDEPIMRPEAAALIADARAAGVAIGVLTNDLQAFHGEESMSRDPFLADVAVLIDGSVTGILKPDPRMYEMAAEALGRVPAEIVFVDDMPWNVEGARRAGMVGVLLDLAHPALAFDVARQALRLAPA